MHEDKGWCPGVQTVQIVLFRVHGSMTNAAVHRACDVVATCGNPEGS